MKRAGVEVMIVTMTIDVSCVLKPATFGGRSVSQFGECIWHRERHTNLLHSIYQFLDLLLAKLTILVHFRQPEVDRLQPSQFLQPPLLFSFDVPLELSDAIDELLTRYRPIEPRFELDM